MVMSIRATWAAGSPSTRRVWIEILPPAEQLRFRRVTLHAEGVD